ncbi:hypothetical protein [Nocardia sp. CY41]|uniref:hypothetical protein n=1 Tax=Nocardia sp. CY41 TaxID=2608686 RepID=UPI0013582482|nr:hypothetical protein [Nocardia sp. CY41]
MWSNPLFDAHGTPIGAIFERDRARVDGHILWAAQETRQADTQVVRVRKGQWGWILSPPEDAPWAEAVRKSGKPPNYFIAHSDNPDSATVSVNRGSKLFPIWVDVDVDGSEFGRMLAAVENSARAIRRNPAGEHVFVMCSSAAPNASTARMAADYLHSTGTVTGNIHAPIDEAVTAAPRGDRMPTWLGVQRPPGSGGKLFETYPGPGNTPAPPEGS